MPFVYEMMTHFDVEDTARWAAAQRWRRQAKRLAHSKTTLSVSIGRPILRPTCVQMIDSHVNVTRAECASAAVINS